MFITTVYLSQYALQPHISIRSPILIFIAMQLKSDWRVSSWLSDYDSFRPPVEEYHSLSAMSASVNSDYSNITCHYLCDNDSDVSVNTSIGSGAVKSKRMLQWHF